MTDVVAASQPWRLPGDSRYHWSERPIALAGSRVALRAGDSYRLLQALGEDHLDLCLAQVLGLEWTASARLEQAPQFMAHPLPNDPDC